MYKVVLTNYGNTQISNKVILDGVILLADYVANISAITSVAGYSVKLDIPARGNVKDKIGNILIRDDSSNTYIAKTILFYKNVNSEKKIIAGFSQNTAIINKLNKSINLFLSFDFSVFTNGFQFALVQAGFSQASQNVDGLVHIEDPNVEFDDSYSVYSKVQIDNKLSSYAQTSDIPTKTSQLTNDSNYINQHQSIKTINNQSLVGTGNIAISQGEYNKINTISVNGTNQAPDSNKNVNITVPTKVSQLDNDLGFITSGVVPTNYVTVNTAQDITAAKTFKNNTDTTKIDGKEIIISGTETYNVEQNPDFPDTLTSATATVETKIDNNTISCNGNSIGYYRNYYALPLESNPGNISYYDGIEIKSKSYDSVWSNTDDKQHEWYSLTITSTDPYAGDSINYIEGLAFSTDIILDNYVGNEENGKKVLFAISKDGAYFNTSVDFNLTTYFGSDVQFSSSTYVNQNNLYISDSDSSTSETIADYVKQASLYYNRANSVITATSDTVIEPSSNNTISLGTSTNGFRNIYTCGGSGTNSIIIGYDTSSMTDDAVIIPSVGSNCYVGTTSNHFMGGYIDNIYSNNITVSNEGQLSVYGNTDTNGIKLCNNSDQTNYAVVHGDSLWDSSVNQESGNLGYANIVLDYYANNEKRASIVNHCEFVEGGSYPTYSMYPVSHTGSSGDFSLGTSDNKFSNIYAERIHGTLHGHASTATSADQDGNGNTISSYYCTLSTEQTISGKKIFYGGNVDFVLGDNTRNISFRYSPTYQSWTWITCYNGTSSNYITLHFTNNNKDVVQLTHTCTSESVNNVQRVKSLVTEPSADNVWQLGALNKRLSNIYTTALSLTSYAVTDGTYHPCTLSTGNYGIHSDADICPISGNHNNLGNERCQWGHIYVGIVGSDDYPVASMFVKDLCLPSGSNSNLVSLPNYLTGSYDNSGSFTTGVAANVGAIRLLYVEIPSGSSYSDWAEPGTQITNKSFKGHPYTVGIAAFHADSSAGSVQVILDFTNVTGTWRMLSAVKLDVNDSIAYKIPFLAIRVA